MSQERSTEARCSRIRQQPPLEVCKGSGRTGIAPRSDPGERALRTAGHTGKCELEYKRKKEITLPRWRVQFSEQCLAVITLTTMVQLMPRNLYMGWVVYKCESRKELGS